MFERNDFGFITKILCPSCAIELLDTTWNEKNEQILKCKNCGFTTIRQKTKERLELEDALKNEPTTSKYVVKEEYEHAKTIIKTFRCEQGWNPLHCRRQNCGSDSYFDCMEYLNAITLVKKIENGELLISNLEKAWQL